MEAPTKQQCKEVDAITIDDNNLYCGSQSQRTGSRPKSQISTIVGSMRERFMKWKRSRSTKNDKSNNPHAAGTSLMLQRSTSERLHKRPVIDYSKRSQINQGGPELRGTIPRSSKSVSQLSVGPVNYPSIEECEEAELQQSQRHAFNAAPLKTGILKEPQVLRKIEPCPVRKLIQDNAACVVKEEVEQLGVKKAMPCTQTTKLEPFTFEERDIIMRQQREEKLKQIFEEERRAREFHANPVPMSIKNPLCQRQSRSRSPTLSHPFRLLTDERMRLHEEEERKAQLEEERKAAEAKKFKARPAVVLQKKPFEPVRPNRVLKEITDLCLNTEMRAKEREKFDKKQKERELLLEELRRERKEEEEKIEEEERARLRREAVHRARPVPKYLRLENQRRS